MKLTKTLGVVRALDLRIQHVENFTRYKKIIPIFISNYDKEIVKYLKTTKVKYKNLKLVPPFLFDPVKFVNNKTSHQSWLHFDQKSLEENIKNFDMYQIQESFFFYSSQVAGIAKRTNKPLIMAPWMCFNHPSSFIPPYSFGVKKTIEQTDLFILRTNRVNEYLSMFNVPDEKKVLLYHGVNTKRFYPSVGKNDKKIKILFVGVLDESKGLGDILKVFPELIKTTKKNLELIVCGKGPLKGRVKEMAKSLPIKYLGQISNLDLPKIYRDCDIFCGPSKDKNVLGVKWWEEGFGFVFAESMASGLPIVTNDCGAIKEVVGKDNYINKQGDLMRLKKSLLDLIEDEKARKDLSVKNRNRSLEMFDMDKQVAKEEKEIIKRFW